MCGISESRVSMYCVFMGAGLSVDCSRVLYEGWRGREGRERETAAVVEDEMTMMMMRRLCHCTMYIHFTLVSPS